MAIRAGTRYTVTRYGWRGPWWHFASLPTALYGVAMPASAYYLLQLAIIRHHGREGTLGRTLGRDLKGKVSPVLDAIAIVFAFFVPSVSHAIYVIVALMWLVPDRRIEKSVTPR